MTGKRYVIARQGSGYFTGTKAADGLRKQANWTADKGQAFAFDDAISARMYIDRAQRTVEGLDGAFVTRARWLEGTVKT